MDTSDDIDELRERQICFNCVGEQFLQNQIAKQGKSATCSYCHKTAECYSIETLSDLIEKAFEQHYCRTSNEPDSSQYAMMKDKEFKYSWNRSGDSIVDAISIAADISDEAASDIQSILEDKFSDFDYDAAGGETDFSSDSHYMKVENATNDDRWQKEWSAFEHSLKTETRFFSQSASRLLASVFDGIDSMRTRDGRPLITDAGLDTKISEVFRARCFQSDEKLKTALIKPDEHLGSPLPAHARAGRMNAHGISVFYGANNPMVALGEVRPPVGSKVVVARFEIIRPIRLLDLTALVDVSTSGSIFDPAYISHLERTMFLRNLSRRITIPVMPEHEMFEYLPTQAIADFLATEIEPPLDGIIFPSVQTKGDAINFVLFHKAARVAAIELPKGTKVNSYFVQRDMGGWVDEAYEVIESVLASTEHLADIDKSQDNPDFDARPSMLKIDLNSINVHVVSAVNYGALVFPVHRCGGKPG